MHYFERYVFVFLHFVKDNPRFSFVCGANIAPRQHRAPHPPPPKVKFVATNGADYDRVREIYAVYIYGQMNVIVTCHVAYKGYDLF